MSFLKKVLADDAVTYKVIINPDTDGHGGYVELKTKENVEKYVSEKLLKYGLDTEIVVLELTKELKEDSSYNQWKKAKRLNVKVTNKSCDVKLS